LTSAALATELDTAKHPKGEWRTGRCYLVRVRGTRVRIVDPQVNLSDVARRYTHPVSSRFARKFNIS
jgi:hypothetical protein